MNKFEGKYCAQGDLNIFLHEKEIPEGCVKLKPEEGRHILAHSETGHNHVVDSSNVEVYKENEFISYMIVKKESNVIHLRGFDTHGPISLPPGVYKLTQQREYTPEGYRRAQD